jgi:cell division protease FtsH
MQKSSMKDVRGRNLRNLAFITIVVIVGLLVLQTWRGNPAPEQEKTYTEFRAFVKRGLIDSVVIRDGSAHAVAVDGSKLVVRLPEDPATYEDLVNQAPGDYVSAFGILTFDPGVQTQIISIATLTDSDYESSETFAVALSDPTAATLGNAIGIVTLLDGTVSPAGSGVQGTLGDAVPGSGTRPRVSVGDAFTVNEGGTAQVTVSLSLPSSQVVTVQYATEDRTAAAQGPTIQFAPPSSSGLLISVAIYVIPVLLLVVFFIYMTRRMQSGAGALAFGQSKAKLFTPDASQTTFADVAGIDEVKEEVEEIVEYLRDQRRFSKLGAEIPKGILLVGAPGTGKTLLAKAIAGEAKVPFFSISGSDFVEMFVGVGAARVRDMFEKAKANSPCIIFIDEIDAVGRKRGAGLGGGHDEREQTLNQLLAEMDGFQPNKGIIILAATNRPDVLDPALLRPGRFDRSVQLPFPALRDRIAILKVHLKERKVGADVDPEILARKTPGFVGADLRNLCNEAALLAARKNKEEVEMADFEEATDRLYLGLRRKSVVPTDKERRLTAYHESGHTLLGFLLKPYDMVVHKISILPRSHGSMGVTQSLPLEERFNPTEQEFRNELAAMLGGRAAEEVVFEEFAAGSGSDLRSATQLATKMVIEWGMNEELGPISLGNDRVNVFLGEDIIKSNEHSEEISSLADREIRRLLLTAYDKAKGLLVQHRGALDQLATEVLAREEISGNDLTRLLNQLLPSPAPG